MTKATRFEAIECRKWVRDDGKTASIFGSVPWANSADRYRWRIRQVGYTVRDHHNNTTGLGRPPFATMAEAQAHAAKLEGMCGAIARENIRQVMEAA